MWCYLPQWDSQFYSNSTCAKKNPLGDFTKRGLLHVLPIALPPIVRERLVRIRHAVRIVLLLYAVPLTLARRYHLGRQLLRHALLAALARVLHEPPHSQRRPALGPNLDGHLIGRAANTPALYLDHRLDVLQRRLEHVHARLSRAGLDEIHGAVEDSLGRGLLALEHQRVDELRNGLAI